MLSVTESPIDLDNAQVLTDSETGVLLASLRIALKQEERILDETTDPTGELVHGMICKDLAGLLDAIDGRTIVLTNPSVDHG